MSTLVIAEKPSVARDLARALGATQRGDGCFRGPDHVVTWAIGHLVALAEPGEMNPAWKKWRLQDLPLLPSSWPLVVTDATRSQFEIVRRLLVARETRDVVCATDAGREGELIFRTIYEAAHAKKPVRRLWISSLTPEAIAEGFRNLRSASAFDGLADAARGRSRADWLVGMNLSRAYSLLYDDNLSVGRVQTPTLAMLVARELELRAFVPEDYLEVVATFDAPTSDAGTARYEGTYQAPTAKTAPGTGKTAKTTKTTRAAHLPADGVLAARVLARARGGKATISRVTRDSRKFPPPQLYDLSELQRHANRVFGFTAQHTLEIAQSLYEKYKLISYPRTDSRHLPASVTPTLPGIVAASAGPYTGLLAPGTGARPLGKRFVDDARVTDHHAILPTETHAPERLPADERRLYDLVCRRLLSAWHEDHVLAVTQVTTQVRGANANANADADAAGPDEYTSSGSSIEVIGWKVLDVRSAADSAGKPRPVREPTLPGGLAPGMTPVIAAARAVKKQTTPPPRFTDGTLLTAMETAGRTLDEREMSEAMRERGLGTPATRAAILETLLRRGYLLREGKALCASDKGIALVERVHPHVKSPAMTGEWEAKLGEIARGGGGLAPFMRGIEDYVREVVGVVLAGAPNDPGAHAAVELTHAEEAAGLEGTGAPAPAAHGRPSLDPGVVGDRDHAPGPARARTERAPVTGPREPATGGRPLRPQDPGVPGAARSRDLDVLLRDAFGLAAFRPYQEEVCRAVAQGKDVLLVMPTGAGKSLCYQLPGVARGGTTLVVSPLIALMEDQVAKLAERGFAAARIHSGRDRAESREVCRAYLAGALDFLFIAPERLRVPGFPELLARRKPSLIAIDEAHCISQWGHDFRPDYRLLGERLPLLRPAPIVALTATATPAVQDDIVAALRLVEPSRYIHGFRRTNIGVEVVERLPGERADVVVSLLSPPERRPAIVYAPTRKEAESLARELGKGGSPMRAAAYHAGLGAGVRDQVQAAFLHGELDVVVATTAFGMGIDKADVRTVVHTALPATVEGYYQEIGRAGRDGAASRAVLLHSFVDTKTHEFFLERDYPSEELLLRAARALTDTPTTPDDLRRRAKIPADKFEKVLEKLWVHGSALVDADGNVRRGATDDWRPAYARQRAHKQAQLDKMRGFAELPSCRMLELVAHFGDRHDSGAPCGTCDVCAPAACLAQQFRAPSPREHEAAQRIVAALAEHPRDGRTVGQLLREVFGDGSLERRGLDHVLAALARAGLVRVAAEEWVKDGETITFQRVHLLRTPEDQAALGLRVVEDDRGSGSKPGKKATRAGATKRGRATRGPSAKRAPRDDASAPREVAPRRPARRSTGPEEETSPLSAALRLWRAAEAKRRRVPFFKVLNDRTLEGIAMARPRDLPELLEVSGMGPANSAKYGAAILMIVART